MTDRTPLDHLTSDQYDHLCDQLDALRQVARGYCPDCGRGDAAPTVEHWEQQKQRADEAERRLRNIANGHPRADSIQAEIGEMIAQTHDLRDQLRAAETALARQAQEMATWRATANTLDAGGPGTPRARAEQAETELAGVRALRDRWVKAGPPPLGTSINRWWDRRLVELNAVLNEEPPGPA